VADRVTPKPQGFKEVLAEMDVGDAPSRACGRAHRGGDDTPSAGPPITKSLLLPFNGTLRHESYGPPVKDREDSGMLAKHASDCASPYTERNYLHYMP